MDKQDDAPQAIEENYESSTSLNNYESDSSEIESDDGNAKKGLYNLSNREKKSKTLGALRDSGMLSMLDKESSEIDNSQRLASIKDVNKGKVLNFKEMSHKINAKLNKT